MSIQLRLDLIQSEIAAPHGDIGGHMGVCNQLSWTRKCFEAPSQSTRISRGLKEDFRSLGDEAVTSYTLLEGDSLSLFDYLRDC